MVSAPDHILDTGFYTPLEAARYARVSSQMLSRWLFGTSKARPAVRPRFSPDGDDRIVTFVDFAQILSVRAIRTQQDVPLQKIRAAIDCLADRHGISFPFARRHELYWFDGDIVYQTGDDSPIFVSGRQCDQHLLRPIVEPHLERLRFDVAGLAEAYIPYSEDGIDVTMRADSRFGEPTLPSGYTAETLWDAVRIEGGYERAAEAYGIDIREVSVAFRYYDSLITAN